MDKKSNIFIALLRGINVGGNNQIKMTDLQSCFEKLGFTEVRTYIQSGNVVFRSTGHDQEKIAGTIETGITNMFKYKIRVVVISQSQLKEAVAGAPGDFGKDPEAYRYDVIFLKEPLTAKEALQSFVVKEGVDQVYGGRDVIYFSRLIKKATQSRIAKIITLPIYKNMTIRNWNTTTKLLALIKIEL